MSNKYRVAIVGSGHSAFGACATLSANLDVQIDIFDIGLVSPYPNQNNRPVANSKSLYDSYFPYGINDNRWPVKLQTKRMCSSHAYGGFSSVYSGAVLEPRLEDLVGWPNDAIPSAEDYDQVLRYFDILGGNDGLGYWSPTQHIKMDSKMRSKPSTFNVILGCSRIAVQSPYSGSVRSPFNSGYVIDQFRSTGRISYKNATYVLAVERIGEKICIRSISEGIEEQHPGYDAVFLGAGCINSTGIVHRSLFPDQTREYQLHSTASFVQGFAGKGPVMSDELLLRRENNIPELFMEVQDDSFSGYWSHTQISAINQHVLETIEQRLPKVMVRKLSELLNSFYFAITSVPSVLAQKSTVICSPLSIEEGFPPVPSIYIEEAAQSHSSEWARTVRQAIRQNKDKLRLKHIPGSEQVGNFLRGNRLGGWHFGGTIPMQERHGDLSTCTSRGELRGIEGVFILDSAAFPSIPGTTVALLTMAHAARVARRWLIS